MATTRSRPTLAALLLALTFTSGCVDVGPPTAYCGPVDPVVTPGRVAPGGELHIEVAGLVDSGDCEPSMPDEARYSIEIGSEVRSGDGEEGPYSTSLDDLDPNSDGGARGTVRVPEDFPLGAAEVSVRLEGAQTLCEIDPTMSCPKGPFAPVDVTS